MIFSRSLCKRSAWMSNRPLALQGSVCCRTLTSGGWMEAFKDAASGLNRQPTVARFPWRAAPPRPFDLLAPLKFKIHASSLAEIIGQSFKQPSGGLNYLNKEFGVGVIGAFPQILRSLFGNQAICTEGHNSAEEETPPPQELRSQSPLDALCSPKSNANAPNVSSDAENDPLLLDSFFHERLVDFFYNALAAVKKADQEIVYRLLQMKLVEPTEILTYIDISRCTNLENSKKPKHFFGFTMVPSKKSANKEKNNPKEGSNTECITVQVDVDVHCQEIFMVKDKISGAILQGGNQISDVIHRLKFEAVFLPQEDWKMDGWLVVDIDNWLEGNKFVEY